MTGRYLAISHQRAIYCLFHGFAKYKRTGGDRQRFLAFGIRRKKNIVTAGEGWQTLSICSFVKRSKSID